MLDMNRMFAPQASYSGSNMMLPFQTQQGRYDPRVTQGKHDQQYGQPQGMVDVGRMHVGPDINASNTRLADHMAGQGRFGNTTFSNWWQGRFGGFGRQPGQRQPGQPGQPNTDQNNPWQLAPQFVGQGPDPSTNPFLPSPYGAYAGSMVA